MMDHVELARELVLDGHPCSANAQFPNRFSVWKENDLGTLSVCIM